MSRRNPLPPPPPPEEIRAWPDREALIADRAAVLGGLTRRLLGVPRLMLFLLVVAGFQLGWGIVGAGLVAGGPDDGLTFIFAWMFGTIAAVLLVPLVVLAGFAVRRDIRVRRLLGQWAALTRDPAGDARFREPARSLSWLLVSFLLGLLGLWLSFAVPAGARPGSSTYGEVVYGMGVGVIFWLAGLYGVTKAVAHYRWAVRLTSPVPPSATPGGAHR
ncbi:hypothetical protein [Streptomyces sp. NPDC000410]|uniref:hypothetical protein n=1 Tax=Streptomyces sp. NPDC000410 TaxID=3154254 RepID=UPI0033287C21